MKRFAITLFALLYLVSSSGLAINNFYCCGKLKKTSLLLDEEVFKKCKCSKDDNCCNTETVYVKVKDNHSPVNSLKLSCSEFANQFNVYVTTVTDPYFVSHAWNEWTAIHAPPLISKQPVYLQVENFRI